MTCYDCSLNDIGFMGLKSDFILNINRFLRKLKGMNNTEGIKKSITLIILDFKITLTKIWD